MTQQQPDQTGKNSNVDNISNFEEKIKKNNEKYSDLLYEKIKSKTNIAITGGNGEGKSSIIQSFLDKYKDIKNKIIVINLSKYKNYQNETKELLEYDNRIESQIINQILYQIDHKNIYLSKYKIKKNMPNSLRIFLGSLSILLIFLMFNLIFCISQNITQLSDWNDKWKLWLIWFVIIILISTISYFFIFYQQWKKISNIDFNIFGSKIKSDHFKNDSLNISVLDIEWREIIYILSHSKKEYVIFENIDKLNNYQLLSKLSELNLMINNYVNLENNKLEKNKIKNSKLITKMVFIYSISTDNLFEEKDKINFFDDIIQVIPILSPEIKAEILMKHLNENQFLDKSWIYEVSKFKNINDLRQIKFISNQYNHYLKENPNKKINKWFDYNKLLSSIIIKCYFYDFYNYDFINKDEIDLSINKYNEDDFFMILISKFKTDNYKDFYNYIYLDSYDFLDDDEKSKLNEYNHFSKNDLIWAEKDISNINIFLSNLLKKEEYSKEISLPKLENKYFHIFLNFNIIKIFLEIEDSDSKIKIILEQIFEKFKKTDYVNIWKILIEKIYNRENKLDNINQILKDKKKQDVNFKEILEMIQFNDI